MPFLGDTMFVHIVRAMEGARLPVFTRTPAEHPFREQLSITDTGGEVLRGIRDWLSLQPPPRFVGGVRIAPTASNWRWDDAQQDVVHG
jgi:hypothetical protein